MIKGLIAAVALTIGFAGDAVAQEAAHRHHHRHRHHHMREPGPFPDALSPSPDAFSPSPEALGPSIYWSPAGGNPIHYGQTTGFYAGR